MSFQNISPDQEKSLLDGVLAGNYTLLLGAGASHDSSNQFGNLPLAGDLLKELLDATEVSSGPSLQKVFATLNPGEVERLVTKRLSGSTPGPTVNGIARYNWRRIFTFNIDDALEQALKKSGRQEILPIHFSDPFVDLQTNAQLPLVYLHGTVNYPDREYVFSRDQYIRVIRGQNPWMVILSSIVANDPLIITGSSMDEVDLEYYLSHRSPASSRDDVGPSVFVSSDVNRISKAFCDQHNLLQFIGYSRDFINYLHDRIPNPPPVEERVAAGIRELLPKYLSRTATIQFDADFELVPIPTTSKISVNKFYHGSPPSWSDLDNQLDISRPVTQQLTTRATSTYGGRQILALLGPTGSGKTTVLKRVAYNLSSLGRFHILWASELGRLAKSTASTIDAIDEPIILAIDNLADHAQSISDVLSLAERDDLFIIGAERSYRKQYLNRMFGTRGYEVVNLSSLYRSDVDRLIEKMTERMLVGSHKVLGRDRTFINSLSRDPIAVATCRVLNDLRPLRRIVGSLISSSSEEEISALTMVGLAEHCFKGGVKRSIVSSFYDSKTLQGMIDGQTALGLRYVDRGRDYVVTENSTISDEFLDRVREERFGIVEKAFDHLALGLAPFVNRKTIRARSPEARLAGRLFDYDDIVERFLGDKSEDFYMRTREAWRWNSRFWEQAALLMLEKSVRCGDSEESKEYLEESLQRARYSVAIENHPFGLTTLGRVLMSLAQRTAETGSQSFEEALECLRKAIDLEKRNGRITQHPYSTIIYGAGEYLSAGGTLTSVQKHEVRQAAEHVRQRWKDEKDIKDSADRLLTMEGLC